MAKFQFLFILLFILSFSLKGQNLDSLLSKAYSYYSDYNYEESIRFADEAILLAKNEGNEPGLLIGEFYKALSVQERDPTQSDTELIEHMIIQMDSLGLKLEQARAHNFLANTYARFGDIEKAVENHQATMDIYESTGNLTGVSSSHSNLSLLYYDQHDYEEAFYHARKALEMDISLGNPENIQSSYNNLAIIFEHTGPLDSAIYYHKFSLEYAKEDENPYSIGLALSNLGNNYANKGDLKLAEETLLEALRIRDSLGYSRGLAYTHNRLANLYQKTDQLSKAKYHADKSLEHAQKAREVKVLRMAYERLQEVAEKMGDYRAELAYLKEATLLKDSILNESNTKSITQMMLNYEFEKKQILDSIKNEQEKRERDLIFNERLELERSRKIIFMISGLFLFLLVVGLFLRYQFIKKSKEVLTKEKDRSDKLLLNILPSEVAEELKATGSSDARDFDQVTVIFTDFADFTKKAQHLSAKELVKELNICFKTFDEIIVNLGLEKIKTIGDAYMAAGGLNSKAGVKEVALAAIQMKKFIDERNADPNIPKKIKFDMRCGINTGPVVAGIVGIKKFQYDIWGDTVNTAQRMEANCEINRINISENTYLLLKEDPHFTFTERGILPVKGKGEMKMWYLESYEKKIDE
ncbi:tetratricopeptide repeat protein [Algoriphagus lutimaris]|uniref:adenylate/guanylate cyclase domain-containing protein n=1 Tax=Algoriphagus lutimaris TaxID=613197 RepID=UPI00196A9D56|nr:adenylate/guanylate cyclase domain-containing protein [Algoriphagus lutimaris]MBN3520945.1 tetratricopeptide repeat protein [Algoriphagus lutimaris]